MSIVIESAGDQNVEACISSFTCGGYQIGTSNRAKLRTDQDAGATLGLTFQEAAFGAEYRDYEARTKRIIPGIY
mgnify:CR=1 FL=1